VPEHIAMKITGHETRRVFDAYNIVSPADLREAARKMAVTSPMVTPTVTQGTVTAVRYEVTT
jgi:hypothetical protein